MAATFSSTRARFPKSSVTDKQIGYSDQQWALAVDHDWLRPDIPIPLSIAKSSRQRPLIGCTPRLIAFLSSSDAGLKYRPFLYIPPR